MTRYISPKLFRRASTLEDIRVVLITELKKFRNLGHKRIGYVSGVITVDGKDHIFRNLKLLSKTSRRLQKTYNFPIFAPSDVSDSKIHIKLEKNGVTDSDWDYFWNHLLLHKKRFITDIFMTPRWELSFGAIEEHLAAQRMNIRIHYLHDEIRMPLKVRLFAFVKRFLHITK